MSQELIRAAIRDVVDFPKPGINFYDVSTLFRDAKAFRATVEAMAAPYRERPLDLVAGIEGVYRLYQPHTKYANSGTARGRRVRLPRQPRATVR